MKARHSILALLAVAVLGAAGFGVYRFGVNRGMQMADTAAAPTARISQVRPQTAGDIDPATGRKVLYWHDPMVPGQKFDKPGKSPFMDMQLVPVYADSAPDATGVAIDPRLQQNLGVRTAKAVAGSLSSAISAVGNVAYNERDVVLVQARSNGFVEKLFVRATLDRVRKGQPLADLYVPEWIAVQEEYLSAKRLHTDVDALALGGLADAA